MKHFTFLSALLLLCTIAFGQNYTHLQSKIRKLQQVNERYSPMMKSLQMNQATLKSTQETQTLDSVIYLTHVAEDDSWMKYEKDSYIYDGSTNTSMLYQEWDEVSGDWTTDTRMEFDYNENALVNVVNQYISDESSEEPVLTNKINLFYNGEGQIDSAVHLYTTDQENWESQTKQVFHYNESNQINRMDIIIWEEDEGVLTIDTASYIYTFDAQNRIESSKMVYAYEEMELTTEETLYSYDDAGRRSSTESSALDFMDLTLKKNYRIDYEYNDSNDIDVETFSTWNEELEEWDPESRDEYTYSTIPYEDVIFPSYNQLWVITEEIIGFEYAVSEINSYTLEGEEWNLTEKTVFYYSEGTQTNSPQIADLVISVYPNPVNDVVTFSFRGYNNLSLEIYSVAGAKIIDRQISPGIGVPVAKLNKGIYLFRLKDQNQTIHSGKLVKN